jgi:hypothetical protein
MSHKKVIVSHSCNFFTYLNYVADDREALALALANMKRSKCLLRLNAQANDSFLRNILKKMAWK